MDESLASKIRAANAALVVDGDLDAVAEYFTPDHVTHLTGRDMKGGHETIRKVLGALRRSFSDLRVEVEILLEGEKRVAWQRTLQGTHTATYKGFPPSGRKIVWRDMATSRFHEGLIAEDWVISDLAEQLLLARKR